MFLLRWSVKFNIFFLFLFDIYKVFNDEFWFFFFVGLFILKMEVFFKIYSGIDLSMEDLFLVVSIDRIYYLWLFICIIVYIFYGIRERFFFRSLN